MMTEKAPLYERVAEKINLPADAVKSLQPNDKDVAPPKLPVFKDHNGEVDYALNALALAATAYFGVIPSQIKRVSGHFNAEGIFLVQTSQNSISVRVDCDIFSEDFNSPAAMLVLIYKEAASVALARVGAQLTGGQLWLGKYIAAHGPHCTREEKIYTKWIRGTLTEKDMED